MNTKNIDYSCPDCVKPQKAYLGVEDGRQGATENETTDCATNV